MSPPSIVLDDSFYPSPRFVVQPWISDCLFAFIASQLDAGEQAQCLCVIQGLASKCTYYSECRIRRRQYKLTFRDQETTREPSTHPTTTKLPRFSA